MTSTRACTGCGLAQPIQAYSRNQWTKEHAKCRVCITPPSPPQSLDQTKRCVQCFQDVLKQGFSKRQYHQVDGKCMHCITQLELEAATRSQHDKWSYDCYYRCCHRGKTGGVGIRSKCHIASPLVGFIPLGRVFCATSIISNEQGDTMVKIDPLWYAQMAQQIPNTSSTERKAREGWIPCRSIRNEVYIERHSGPWHQQCRYYRCVIEGCKVRVAPDLSLTEIGYLLYGDVIQVVECIVTMDGIVLYRLQDHYFDGPAWVVERTLDNESVLNPVDGPFVVEEGVSYQCVQVGGAPVRHQPSLTAPPKTRIPCGSIVKVVERKITLERQVFLRIKALPLIIKQPPERDATECSLWIIETSTVCASVMVPVLTMD